MRFIIAVLLTAAPFTVRAEGVGDSYSPPASSEKTAKDLAPGFEWGRNVSTAAGLAVRARRGRARVRTPLIERRVG